MRLLHGLARIYRAAPAAAARAPIASLWLGDPLSNNPDQVTDAPPCTPWTTTSPSHGPGLRCQSHFSPPGSWTSSWCDPGARLFSSSSSPDYSKEVEDINNLFVEARDEIEFALEDADTVYFNDSVTEAKESVDKCLNKWTALLTSLPQEESLKLQRSMGLKMEQLKAEFESLRKTHLED